MTRKQQQHARLRETLELWRVLGRAPEADGPHGRDVRTGLEALEASDPTLGTMIAVRYLVDAALSQALGRDPGVPYVYGVKQALSAAGKP
jgi:hypothetical protein